MYKIIHLFLALLICGALPIATSAAAKRPTDVWNYYHFDGSAFISGPAVDGRAYLAVREKVLPLVVKDQSLPVVQTALSDGEGVIAGICYLQSSGGKLGGGSGYQPCSHSALLISAGGKQLVSVQTDDHGFFVIALPAGRYSIGSGQFKAEITVEPGITTLAPLRAGKRMVD